MRITFHVRKYTVTIIIRETHTKDRSEKKQPPLAQKVTVVLRSLNRTI